MSKRGNLWTGGLLGCALALSACSAPGGGTGAMPASEADVWRSELIAWRAEREAGLRDPEGYLGLSDLVWLRDGAQSFGSGPDAALRLSDPDILERAGILELRDGQVRLAAEPGVALLVDGEPVREAVLRSDAEGEPSRVQLGRFSFWLIDRSGMLGIRVRDPRSPVLAAFHGVDQYEAAADWRVPARFLPYATPHDVAIPNVLGSTYQSESSGRLEFEWQGATYTLEPTGSDPAELFLVFGDATNGKTTYGGGRFLRVPEPDADGRLLLDFNRAYNPPCAFSPFTTCPLPTAANRLSFEVTAGERTPAGH